MTEHLTLSHKELDRLQILTRIAEGRLSRRRAAELLGLSERQVYRLYDAFRARGAAGLASTRRGRPSHRKIPMAVRVRALGLIREHYGDFGPTLACEKLVELHGLRVSVETVRSWMIEADIWLPRSRRTRRSYQPRERRACAGELVQIDGSRHEWFEERGPACTLLVYIDDATGRLAELRFADSESTFDYFAATRSYLEKYGKPMAFYSDRLSVFHVARADKAAGGPGLSQFGRAMNKLNIDVICANSPQAKGRVERANKTLQDRLVKELRLRGISDVVAGQAYLPEFQEDHNRRFARPPRNSFDAHRPVHDDEDLETIFTLQDQRKVSENLTVNHKRVLYVLEDTVENRKLRGHQVTVHEHENGKLSISHSGRTILFRGYAKDETRISQGAIVENKRLGAALGWIAERQRQRDLERLANPKTSIRQKKRIRATADLTA